MREADLATYSVYDGSSFSVSVRDDEFTIWRFYDEDGKTLREKISLNVDGMEELATYFQDYFAEDC